MELQKNSVSVREKVKLLVYFDVVLDRPIIVDLVFEGETPDIDKLAQIINLEDLVESVRQAHKKLPFEEIFSPEQSGKEATVSPVGPQTTFKIPAELMDKRFVFPASIKKILAKAPPAEVRTLLYGHGEGELFHRYGLLGRAAQQELMASSELPFYCATLAVLANWASDELHNQLLEPGKVKESYDSLRVKLHSHTIHLPEAVMNGMMAKRILDSPLSLYALRRKPAPGPVDEVEQLYLAYPNAYFLTPALVQCLDRLFEAEPNTLGHNEKTYETLVERLEDTAEHIRQAGQFWKKQKSRNGLNWSAIVCFLVVSGALFLPWLLNPFNQELIQDKLSRPNGSAVWSRP